ncbi:hypothetical protein CCACVL1_23609 [Corchorus capsularis]|uniref:Uncharacterized protein n=1 Tax=Corchorus capsularis TaxID=210143 RepID=A0A1R3GTB7_COCAP|nr:hypothetical protein CCACVL1_23609 [Corchorus capsularis]
MADDQIFVWVLCDSRAVYVRVMGGHESDKPTKPTTTDPTDPW